MALSPNLPPQAYTRDTLVKAIEWMSSQPVAMRERASSADLIVSHYLASRRRMPYPSELPNTDFKAIAESLKALEDLDGPRVPAQPTLFEQEIPEPMPPPMMAPPPPMPPPTRAPRRRETPRQYSASYAPAPPPAPAPVEIPPEPRADVGPARGETEYSVNGMTWVVDQRSRAIAREVQDRMNLSSESEALRMLVAMGAERLRSVLP